MWKAGKSRTGRLAHQDNDEGDEDHASRSRFSDEPFHCIISFCVIIPCDHSPTRLKSKSLKPLMFKALRVVAGVGFEPTTFRL